MNKLKKSDFSYSDVFYVHTDLLLDVCRMLDDLVKRGAVFTASLSEGEVWDNVHILTVEYTIGTSVKGTFSIPGGTWINVVRGSNPAFHFLPYL